MTLSALINAGSNILGKAASSPAPVVPRQDASGYAQGGMSDGRNAGGSTGGATGGATGGVSGGIFSQANVDGSNWNVVTGGGSIHADGQKSGGNGGVTPSMDFPKVFNPFQAQNPFNAQSPFQAVGQTLGNAGDLSGRQISQGLASASSGTYLLIGLGLLAVVLVMK